MHKSKFTETVQSGNNYIKGAFPIALRKTDIVDYLKDQIGFTREKAVELFEILLEIIKSTLESAEDILISEFGRFCTKNKKKRREKIRQPEMI